MKVSRVKELLSQYSDDDELMIAWFDIEPYDSNELTPEVWKTAVKDFDESDLHSFSEICDTFVHEAIAKERACA